MGTLICSHSKCPDQPVTITFLWSAEITFLKKKQKKNFQDHFQIFKRLGSRSGSVDLGSNCLHSKIVDQDLHCVSDKTDFTIICSTLNESSIFLKLIFDIVVRFQNNFFPKIQEHCQSVKQFGSRSGPTKRQSQSGS